MLGRLYARRDLASRASAVANLRRVVEVAPDSVAARIELAELVQGSGSRIGYADALKLYLKAIKVLQARERRRRQRARDEARTYGAAARAAAAAPKGIVVSAELWCNVCALQLKLGDGERAADALRRAYFANSIVRSMAEAFVDSDKGGNDGGEDAMDVDGGSSTAAAAGAVADELDDAALAAFVSGPLAAAFAAVRSGAEGTTATELLVRPENVTLTYNLARLCDGEPSAALELGLGGASAGGGAVGSGEDDALVDAGSSERLYRLILSRVPGYADCHMRIGALRLAASRRAAAALGQDGGGDAKLVGTSRSALVTRGYRAAHASFAAVLSLSKGDANALSYLGTVCAEAGLMGINLGIGGDDGWVYLCVSCFLLRVVSTS